MTDYGIQFAPTLDRPPETMVGETVFDSEGNAIGWIANAVHRPDEPEEVDTLKLHDRMNAALLDYESAMGIDGGSGANTVPFINEMHQIIEDAAKAGVGTCHCTTPDDAWCFSCSSCGKSFPRNELHMAYNHGEINYCPNCGAKVVAIKL